MERGSGYEGRREGGREEEGFMRKKGRSIDREGRVVGGVYGMVK